MSGRFLLKKYEREAYVSKGKYLTDKQIIRLEFKRIKQEYEKQSKKLRAYEAIVVKE